jgi:hypothetical protein
MDRCDDWLFFFLSHNDILRDFWFMRFGLYEYLSSYDTVFGRQAYQPRLLVRRCQWFTHIQGEDEGKETAKYFHQGQSRPHLGRVLAGLPASEFPCSATNLLQLQPRRPLP